MCVHVMCSGLAKRGRLSVNSGCARFFKLFVCPLTKKHVADHTGYKSK